MEKQAQSVNWLERLNLVALGSAVALTLTIGILTWALSAFVWPGLAQAIRGLVVEDAVLVNAFLVAGILIGKEFVVRNRPLNFTVNTLALFAGLGYLAFYLSANVAALLVYAQNGLATG